MSSAKATEAPRPMSRFSKRVATNVTIQIICRGDSQPQHGLPMAPRCGGEQRAIAKPQGQLVPYQVHAVGLPERAEVCELLEHALEVDDDDGSQDSLGEKAAAVRMLKAPLRGTLLWPTPRAAPSCIPPQDRQGAGNGHGGRGTGRTLGRSRKSSPIFRMVTRMTRDERTPATWGESRR